MFSLMSSIAMSACFVLTPALQVAPADSAAPVNDAAVERKVDAIAADFLARPGGVGLSIGVAREGKLLLSKGYGLADAEFDVPANGETLFRIGSVTKQFTAAAIMLLVQEQKLSLDVTLEKLVPEFPTSGRTVTLRQLLNHTSGIPSYTDIGADWVAKWPIELTDAELLALVDGRAFDFEPGEGWNYNNTGYYLLGMIVANAGGTTYGAHLERVLFQPLKLERTRYDSNRELIRNRAQGYTLDGPPTIVRPSSETPTALFRVKVSGIGAPSAISRSRTLSMPRSGVQRKAVRLPKGPKLPLLPTSVRPSPDMAKTLELSRPKPPGSRPRSTIPVAAVH